MWAIDVLRHTGNHTIEHKNWNNKQFVLWIFISNAPKPKSRLEIEKEEEEKSKNQQSSYGKKCTNKQHISTQNGETETLRMEEKNIFNTRNKTSAEN